MVRIFMVFRDEKDDDHKVVWVKHFREAIVAIQNRCKLLLRESLVLRNECRVKRFQVIFKRSVVVKMSVCTIEEAQRIDCNEK